MRDLGLKVFTIAAALAISPLLLSAAEQDSQANDNIQLDPIVREGTAHLNYDDATRARYHFHNGHWMFETEEGQWLIHQNGAWKRSRPMKDITTTLQMSSYTAQVPSEPGLEPVAETPPMIESLPDGGVIFRPPAGGNPLGPYFDQFIPSYARTGRGGYGGSYFNSFRRW
ncbi:hypothetical protein [Gimesia maris]|uniref:hypothetical protein n=1 Tax=Gimesia maris TaxID=122 RepID=UPI0032ED17F5